MSQRSPNGVHPIPTIATRSRMPLLAISRSPRRAWPSRSNCGPRWRCTGAGTSSRPGCRSRTAAGSTSVISQRYRPPPSKSTTTPTTGGDRLNARRSTVNVATVPLDVGQPLGLHLVDGVAVQADPGRRQVAEPAMQAPARRERVLPRLGAVRRRRARALGVGPTGRLADAAGPARSGTGCRAGRRARPRPVCDRRPRRRHCGRPGRPAGRRSCGGRRRRRRRRAPARR